MTGVYSHLPLALSWDPFALSPLSRGFHERGFFGHISANWPQVVEFRTWLSDDDDWDEEDARLFEEEADDIEQAYFV